LPVGLEQRLRRKSGFASLLVGDVDALQVVRRDRFVPDVQVHQRLAPIGPLPEVGIERDSWKFALQVERVLLAIDRIVQDAVDVVENRVLGNRTLGLGEAGLIALVKAIERPVGDVVHASCDWNQYESVQPPSY